MRLHRNRIDCIQTDIAEERGVFPEYKSAVSELRAATASALDKLRGAGHPGVDFILTHLEIRETPSPLGLSGNRLVLPGLTPGWRLYEGSHLGDANATASYFLLANGAYQVRIRRDESHPHGSGYFVDTYEPHEYGALVATFAGNVAPLVEWLGNLGEVPAEVTNSAQAV